MTGILGISQTDRRKDSPPAGRFLAPPVAVNDYLSILSQSAQMVGVTLIAAILWPVVRVIRARYLEYWAWGWSCLAVALVALFLSFRVGQLAPPAAVPLLRAVYCLGEFAFAYLLWAGTREYVSGRPIRRAELVWLLPLAGYAVVGPFLLPALSDLFGWQAAALAGFFAAALWETRRFRPVAPSRLGRRLCQIALAGLVVLFAHYSVVLIWNQFFGTPHTRYPHLVYSSVYDAALEFALALGMVTIATERLRAELEGTNRRLAEAVAELELASRTDPLTGLLNRRGLDDVLARPDLRAPHGSVAAIDVNDLKPLNDRHGHDAGDVALQLVARALRNLFRVTDPLFRLGGDEFLVVMPGGTADDLTRRMEALDKALVGHRLSGVNHPLDVRVAWGVAAYPDAGGLAAAVKAADDAMFAQKKVRKGGTGR